jgi:hypothetical protein
VVIDYLLDDILRNQDATGRISKWAVKLSALNIDFKPRTTIKSQALVDFMAEWRENRLLTPTDRPEYWVMYLDGSLKLEGAGAAVLLISQRANNSSTSCRSSGRSQTTKTSMKSITRALPRNIIGHQATTSLRRLHGGHQSSQQVLGSQQGEHGRLLPRSSQSREQVLQSRVPSRRP